MTSLEIHLFGRLHVLGHGQTIPMVEGNKACELLCYLLLHRDRSHPREALAGTLWGDVPTTQAKTYLRKALWQLQTTLGSSGESSPLLAVERDWVEVHLDEDTWLDIDRFEQAYQSCHHLDHPRDCALHAEILQHAITLYRGDLLDGWYQDWCLFERERYQQMYLAMLDGLALYHEGHAQYLRALEYATEILRFDRARERTHQQLMRIYALANDRSAALRQYEQCAAILEEELGVEPAPQTRELYEQIRAGLPPGAPPPGHESSVASSSQLRRWLDHLRRLQGSLAEMRAEIDREIAATERRLVEGATGTDLG
ncbi:MAG: hypothetical protein Kow0047_30940 [Anaerolineae bacterium]